MARVIRRTWQGTEIPGLPRRERGPCKYESYLPDRIAERAFALDGDVAADVATATSGIERLNAMAGTLLDTETLARLLLRAEAVASSRIEGLEVGARRLLHAETARKLGEASTDVAAEEVMANIEAMRMAVDELATGPLSVDGLLEAQKRLLTGTRLAEHAGRVRTEQNWIGGNSYNPCGAAFVPPPHENVLELLEDLVLFCEREDLPVIAQAAIAHAQFETIHPFVDGNGRIGRALIHIVLRRHGAAPRVVPPISLVLATRAKDYVSGLVGTRYLGTADSAEAHAGINSWISSFSNACIRSVEDAISFENVIRTMQDDWRTQLKTVRSGSAIQLLLEHIPAAPLLTVQTASELIGRSYQQTNLAVGRLEAASILRRTTVGKRNRAYEATSVINAFTDFERQLASPEADTRISPPVRRTPNRRRD